MSIDIKCTSEVGTRVAELNKCSPQGRVASQAKAAAETAAANDVVTLTDAAASLAVLIEAAAAAPAVDVDKVERIKLALASGEYSVDPHQVARKLMMLEGGME
jgi:negative regulator of flagellin synthesis FlgM